MTRIGPGPGRQPEDKVAVGKPAAVQPKGFTNQSLGQIPGNRGTQEFLRYHQSEPRPRDCVGWTWQQMDAEPAERRFSQL